MTHRNLDVHFSVYICFTQQVVEPAFGYQSFARMCLFLNGFEQIEATVCTVAWTDHSRQADESQHHKGRGIQTNNETAFFFFILSRHSGPN